MLIKSKKCNIIELIINLLLETIHNEHGKVQNLQKNFCNKKSDRIEILRALSVLALGKWFGCSCIHFRKGGSSGHEN